MSIVDRLERLKVAFDLPRSAIYPKLIEWGKKLPPFSEQEKMLAKRVPGCQSEMWLFSKQQDGKLYFAASSDALISSGLAALLLELFNGLTAEEILQIPASFLEEMQIPGALSPGRVNGLSSLFTEIKRTALKALQPL